MRLSERLEAILVCCGSGDCAADVGTDHGMVPIELVSRGRFARAIAMDVRRGPLSRAAEHIRERGLEERIETRLSDGLAGLLPGEADVIIMTGMGGPLMDRILREGMETAGSAKKLVLSPQSDIPAFRRGLHEKGFVIREEALLLEDSKEYHILQAVPGREPAWSEEEYQYGKTLLEARHPLLRRSLQREIAGKAPLIRKLREAEKEAGRARAEELAEECARAEGVLERFFGEREKG